VMGSIVQVRARVREDGAEVLGLGIVEGQRFDGFRYLVYKGMKFKVNDFMD